MTDIRISSLGRPRGRSKLSTWILLGIGVLAFIILVLGNSELRSKGYIEIQVPNESSYWCKEYSEENGCVIFKDQMGRSRKICGTYQIIK